MAVGDAAAAAGLHVSAQEDDLRDGWIAHNTRGDELAAHMEETSTALAGKAATGHTHPYTQITGTSFEVGDLPNAVAVRDSAGALHATAVEISEATVDDHAVSIAWVRDVGAGVMKVGAETVAQAIARIDAEADDTVGEADKVTSAAYSRTVSGGNFAMWMDSSHNIGRNTSSIRYKEDIEPAAVDPAAVLALQPVTYHRKTAAPGNREYGLIAEDVHDHVPEIVTWYGGRIDGVRYDLLAVALLDVVKDLAARVAILEGAAQ